MSRELIKDINKINKKLLRKIEIKGVIPYENFGGKELNKLEEKYNEYFYDYDKEIYNMFCKFRQYVLRLNDNSRKGFFDE